MKDHTILVVDDSRTNLQIIRDVLELHYTLQLAISGEMAIKFVNKKKPDLILLDLMMPGMNGKVNDESTAFHAITPLVLASLYDTTFCRSLLLFFAPVGCDACSIFPAGKVPSCCDCCWFAAVNFTESGKYLMFVGQEIIDSNIIPIVIPTVESNELNGKDIMKISTRSGPPTKFQDTGTYDLAGQYLRVLARTYDNENEIWWVKCVIPTNGQELWTGYDRFDHSTLPLVQQKINK